MKTFTGQNDRNRVLDATDIVDLIGTHVNLRRTGREFVGLCPFHDDHNPSMHVVPHKNIFKCFVCGAGHNALDFVMKFHRMDFPSALRYLAERAGIELSDWRAETPQKSSDGPSRQDLLEANRVGAEFFRAALNGEETGQRARAVVESRGMSPEIVETFALGAAPDRTGSLATLIARRGLHRAAFEAVRLIRRSTGGEFTDYFRKRLVFPICNQLGQVVAFGGRTLDPDDQPKYLNSPESAVFHKSRTLYGLNLAHQAITSEGSAVICEGYTDVIAMHQFGFTNAVATLGTSLTDEHAAMLHRLCDTVILLFDGDEAGIRAADRAIEVFFAHPIDVRICTLPRGVDPDELLKRPGGVDAMRRALDDATDALELVVRRFRDEMQSVETVSGRQKRMQEFLQRLVDLGFHSMPGIRKRLIVPRLAAMLGVSLRDLEQVIPAPRRTARTPARSSEPSEREEPLIDARSALTPARRARLANEREMIALLLHDPSLGSTDVHAGEGYVLPLHEAFLPESIADETNAAIYAGLHDFLESSTACSLHDITSALRPEEQEQCYALAVAGERIADRESDNVVQYLQGLCEQILEIDDRESCRQAIATLRHAVENRTESGADSLVEVVRQRREHGDNYAAIARGLRSS